VLRLILFIEVVCVKEYLLQEKLILETNLLVIKL